MLKNKKGFTLIELVIVMAIVGILAITAIVALSSKSVDARNARRKSDMAAVLTAMQLYCGESSATITCGVGTSAVLNTCTDDPGSYIDLSTVEDPDADASALCVDADGASGGGLCDYTILEGTGGEFAPCTPAIAFVIEATDGTYDAGCATQKGISTPTGGVTAAACAALN